MGEVFMFFAGVCAFLFIWLAILLSIVWTADWPFDRPEK